MFIFLSFILIPFSSFNNDPTHSTLSQLTTNYTETIRPAICSTGKNISKKGTYTLSSDIVAQEKISSGAENGFIIISANDVILDLNCFTLSNSSSNNGVTAIIIDSGVSHVIIKNGFIGISSGSGNFASGILCRDSCTDITLENIIVEKIVDGSPISFVGTSGNEIRNITLRNIASSDHSGATPHAFLCTYTNSVNIENVTLNFTTSTTTFTACDISNCNNISINNGSASFNSGSGGQTALWKCTNSKTITLQNLEANHNDNSSPGNLAGVYPFYFDTVDSIQAEQFHIKNNANFINGIYASSVNEAVFENVYIHANSTEADNNIAGLLYNNCFDINIINLHISKTMNNNVDESPVSLVKTSGVESSGTNANITLNQCNITNNKSINGPVFGVQCTATPDLSIENSFINNNSSNNNYFQGISVISSPESTISHVKITGNTAANIDASYLFGVHILSSSSSKLNHINVSENRSGKDIKAIFIESSDNCFLESCLTNHNQASTDAAITQVGQTAGIMLKNSSYTTVKNCESSHNIGGNFDASIAQNGNNTASFGTALISAGFIDYATNINTPNKNNAFEYCLARGNKTAWTDGVAPQYPDTDYQQWKSYAQAAGFYIYDVTGTLIDHCVANNNGSANEIIGYGIYLNRRATRARINDSEVSSNSWHGISGDATTLSTLATNNFAFANATSSIAQELFSESKEDQNFYFPNSPNIPFILSRVTIFNSLIQDKTQENIIHDE